MPNDMDQITANILRQQAETIRVLVDLGYERDKATKAVTSDDLASLAPVD